MNMTISDSHILMVLLNCLCMIEVFPPVTRVMMVLIRQTDRKTKNPLLMVMVAANMEPVSLIDRYTNIDHRRMMVYIALM